MYMYICICIIIYLHNLPQNYANRWTYFKILHSCTRSLQCIITLSYIHSLRSDMDYSRVLGLDSFLCLCLNQEYSRIKK